MRSAVSLTVVSEWWYVIYILLIREMNDKTRKLQLEYAKSTPGINFVPTVSLTGQVGEIPGDEVGLG